MSGLVIQEWMEAVGGAERVVKSVLRLDTNADLFCLWSNYNDPELQNTKINESWLARTALSGNKGLSLPFMPATWKLANFEPEPEWVFVSSHLFAHHVSLNKNLSHLPGINYIHSPARYIWSPELDERANNILLKTALPALRSLDKSRAMKSNYRFMANSKNVQQRVSDYWGIDSEILYPPVRVNVLRRIAEGIGRDDDWATGVAGLGLPSEFVIGVGRFIPYKRLDQVIRTAARMNIPAVLIGSGKLENYYRKLATELRVRLLVLSGLSDIQVAEVIYRSKALIFAGVEDFGIVPVEAMALGVPVIALGQGGACETVEDGVAGYLIDDFNNEDLVEIVSKAIDLPKDLISESVGKFDEAEFSARTLELIGSLL